MADTKPSADLALIRRLWPYAQQDRALFALALLATPLSMVLSLLQPWLLKVAVDDYITEGRLDGLQGIALAYLGSVLAAYGLSLLYTMSMSYAGQRLILRLREAIFSHLVGLAPAYFDKRPAGELLTRATSDVEALGETLSSGVVTIVLDGLMIAGVLSAMLYLEWRLTLVLFAVAPPLLLVLEVCRRRLRHYYNQVREGLSRINAFLAERINGVEVLQLYRHEEATRLRFRELNRPYTDAAIQSNIWDALMYAAVDGVGSVCIALMLWYGTGDALGGVVTAGLMVAFLEYLQRLFQPLREFSGKVAIIQRAGVALERIFGLLDADDRITPGDDLPQRPEGRLRFTDLRFAYSAEGEDVIKGVSFAVNPGEVVALVGPTGCGKTTLTRLITRTYQGYRGSLTLDGREVSELNADAVRQHIASVSQEIQLFPESVRFNVNLGNPAVSDAQVEAAAALVHADRFVDAFPEGWEHVLRERGGNLSVGEGQLLTFARTMAYDPVVVILDEATASVDPVTEGLIQSAIQRIFERKTVIVVAHRLSTIQAADRIVVLEAGEVAEIGDHESLMAQGGRYAELVAAGLGEVAAEEP